MFEYFITISKQNQSEGCPGILKPGIIYPEHMQDSIVIDNIRIEYLTRKDEHEFLYQDDDTLVLIHGTVFSSKDNGDLSIISPGELTDITEQKLVNLRGHFHIISLNKRNRSLQICNDIFGLKPAYYGENDHFFFIANSLFTLRQFSPIINESTLIEKLIFHHSLGTNTLYKDIYSIEEATVLKYDGTFSLKKYFSWYDEFKDADTKSLFDIDQFILLFNNIIYARGDANNPNLIPFTGGHDGRAVLSGFLSGNLPVETFSFGRPGSENTKIPETAAKRLQIEHKSIYLLEEFEKEYSDNAYWTSFLSDGELNFNQQTLLYSASKIPGKFKQVYSGLLAGEAMGPVHLLTDYISPEYYKCIYSGQDLKWDSLMQQFLNTLQIDISSSIKEEIAFRLDSRKQNLEGLASSKNMHLFSLVDMITWGFRRFYGSQMHLIRYHLENLPVFYDFDLMWMLMRTTYGKIYKSSYRSRFHRRNSRYIQLQIVNSNSETLSNIPLDRGYTPSEAVRLVSIPKKLYRYYRRKWNISKGNYIADFNSGAWSNNLILEDIFSSSEVNRIISSELKNELNLKRDSSKRYSEYEMNLISNLLAIQ